MGVSGWRLDGNRVDGHANENALQRVVRMPRREAGAAAERIDERARKQRQRVGRQIGGTQPIVLERMGQLMREKPWAVPLKKGGLDDDGVADGDGAEIP